MGYNNAYLLSVVFEEAVILAVLGFCSRYYLAFGTLCLSRASNCLAASHDSYALQFVLILTLLCVACLG